MMGLFVIWVVLYIEQFVIPIPYWISLPLFVIAVCLLIIGGLRTGR
jgi:hypothetical protein